MNKYRDGKTGQYKHDWGFKANAGSLGKGDLLQCQHDDCRIWSYMGEKPYFKMTHEEYVAMHESGEINATEVLGIRESDKKCKTCPTPKDSSKIRTILWKKGESKYKWNAEGTYKCNEFTCEVCGNVQEFINL